MEVRARRRREAFLQRERAAWAGGQREQKRPPSSAPTTPPTWLLEAARGAAGWQATGWCLRIWRKESRESGTPRWCGFLLVLFYVSLFWLCLKSGRTRRGLCWNWRLLARVYEDAFAAVVVCRSANSKLCPCRLQEKMLEVDAPCRVHSSFMFSLH